MRPLFSWRAFQEIPHFYGRVAAVYVPFYKLMNNLVLHVVDGYHGFGSLRP